jgi:hypothetical protein
MSVRRKFLSRTSFSLLKVDTTTPTNRFSMRKFDRMTKRIKKRDQPISLL